ncbi:protein SDA1 protein [Trifolium repens]|nr:protein SDA1 protein [Trifolium repens]
MLNGCGCYPVDYDPTVQKELAERALFLALVGREYPKSFLADFPLRLLYLLLHSAESFPSAPRLKLAEAFVVLVQSKRMDFGDALPLFMQLQTLGDTELTKLVARQVVLTTTERLQFERCTRKIQNIMFNMLENETGEHAKRVLVTLWELYQEKVWFDDRTANAICDASALSFLLLENDNKKQMIENEGDHDDSDNDAVDEDHNDGSQPLHPFHLRKRLPNPSSERSNVTYYSPLNHLIDMQGFAESLFCVLQCCTSEVETLALKLTARLVGLHQLTLLEFYPFVQKYIKSHQQDAINVLEAVVQACHDKVPRNAVEPLFKQIVNQFVNDSSPQEVITVGLNAVREICIRMPLLMNEDLLRDLALYDKSLEEANSEAARSLIALFQEVSPFETMAIPKAGEDVYFANDVPGDELLQNTDNDGNQESVEYNDSACFSTDHESLGTKSKTEDSIKKRKFSDFIGKHMADSKVEEQHEERTLRLCTQKKA